MCLRCTTMFVYAEVSYTALFAATFGFLDWISLEYERVLYHVKPQWPIELVVHRWKNTSEPGNLFYWFPLNAILSRLNQYWFLFPNYNLTLYILWPAIYFLEGCSYIVYSGICVKLSTFSRVMWYPTMMEMLFNIWFCYLARPFIWFYDINSTLFKTSCNSVLVCLGSSYASYCSICFW